MDLPIYEIVAGEGGFLYRVSMVDSPAVEYAGMFFNEETEIMKFSANEEKRLLYAPALIPNKMIFRKDVKGSPANTFYTAETIEVLNDTYFKNICNAETNINHEINPTDGIHLVESWIVLDNKNDKATALGFDVPNGTLMMCHKIENDSVWNSVKSGDLTGLSVEMLAKYELRNDKFNINMGIEEKKGFIAEIIDGIKMAFEPKKVEVEAVSEGEPVQVETKELMSPEEIDALKSENEMLKLQLQEATDKLAEYEAQNQESTNKSMLMSAEIKELKTKIAFEAEIPKIPTAPIAGFENDPIEKMKNGRRI